MYISDVINGYSLGNDPAVAPNSVSRPKSERHPATIVDTGFHSAKYCSARGIPVVGAKAFDKNVSGKSFSFS